MSRNGQYWSNLGALRTVSSFGFPFIKVRFPRHMENYLRGSSMDRQWPVPIPNSCSNYTSLRHLVGLLGRGNGPNQGPVPTHDTMRIYIDASRLMQLWVFELQQTGSAL